MNDQSEHCPTLLRAWADSQAIGGGPRGRTHLQCKVIAHMNVCVSFPLINSRCCVDGGEGRPGFRNVPESFGVFTPLQLNKNTPDCEWNARIHPKYRPHQIRIMRLRLQWADNFETPQMSIQP
jgi:hypothetical protein